MYISSAHFPTRTTHDGKSWQDQRDKSHPLILNNRGDSFDVSRIRQESSTQRFWHQNTLSLAHSAAEFWSGNMPFTKYMTDKIGTHTAIALVCYLHHMLCYCSTFDPQFTYNNKRLHYLLHLLCYCEVNIKNFGGYYAFPSISLVLILGRGHF